MLAAAFVTSSAWSTGGAARKFPFPDWLARTRMVPAPSMVRVLPEMLPGPLTMLKESGSAEVAVADRSKAASPKVLPAGWVKVISCGALVMVRVALALP